MGSDLEHRILARLAEIDGHVDEIVSQRDTSGMAAGDNRSLLLALDARLAALADALER